MAKKLPLRDRRWKKITAKYKNIKIHVPKVKKVVKEKHSRSSKHCKATGGGRGGGEKEMGGRGEWHKHLKIV